MLNPTRLFLPVAIPANAREGTRIWFTRFNEAALARGQKLAAELPSAADLRKDSAYYAQAGNGYLQAYNLMLANLIETDVRLLGLRAIVGDYNTHPDRVVARMYASDYRRALFAQIEERAA